VRIEILDRAEDDLVRGFGFYEEQQAGLGAHFRECLLAAIDLLCIHGGVHWVAYRDFRRALSKRFPLAIFYTVSGETVFIHAVVDCRRRPVRREGARAGSTPRKSRPVDKIRNAVIAHVDRAKTALPAT